MIKLTHLYRKILKDYQSIHISVDMTCGKGNDTLFLSEISKKVYSFDIQKNAINKAKELTKNKDNIIYICDNHEHILKYIQEKIDVAIYNLGYLPGGNKDIKTTASTTIHSLKSLMTILNDSGIIIIEVYPHNKEESLALDHYITNLDHTFDVLKIDLYNKVNPPYLIVIKKALK
ncbi:class I SAM-dependent methyltransferase [Mycoplasmatota bacterium]|nr:class I SAM-dependent methyltransferase [Mycoplasmatota bacterium]